MDQIKLFQLSMYGIGSNQSWLFNCSQKLNRQWTSLLDVSYQTTRGALRAVGIFRAANFELVDAEPLLERGPRVRVQPPPGLEVFLPLVMIGVALVFPTINAMTKFFLDLDKSEDTSSTCNCFYNKITSRFFRITKYLQRHLRKARLILQ